MKPVALSIAAALWLAAPAPVAATTLPPGFDDNPSVVDALVKARGTGKPVIVYVTEHNCHACGALDGWLVRSDIRQAFSGSYHFSMVFGDDMVQEERDRWRATYVPRGAPSWVVLGADGSYVCTATGGFVDATAAMELHKLLTRVASRPAAAAGSGKPRSCNARALGI